MHYSHYSLVLFVAHEINKIDENRTEPQHNNIAATTHQHAYHQKTNVKIHRIRCRTTLLEHLLYL